VTGITVKLRLFTAFFNLEGEAPYMSIWLPELFNRVKALLVAVPQIERNWTAHPSGTPKT
jgi:hypothetical protein